MVPRTDLDAEVHPRCDYDSYTLGRGTCRNDSVAKTHFVCSECDAEVDMYDFGGFAMSANYCPNCGRKVVDK